MWLDFDVSGQQGMNFSQEEAYFGQKWQFKVKMPWWICFFVLPTHYFQLKLSRFNTQIPTESLLIQLEEVLLVRPAGGAHPVVCVGPNAPV